MTDLDGVFEFSEVFFHDMDRIQISVEAQGYEAAHWDSVDFYCYYCNCFGSPLQIMLSETPDSLEIDVVLSTMLAGTSGWDAAGESCHQHGSSR